MCVCVCVVVVLEREKCHENRRPDGEEGPVVEGLGPLGSTGKEGLLNLFFPVLPSLSPTQLNPLKSAGRS